MKIILIISILLAISLPIFALDGPNVCEGFEEKPVLVKVETKIPFQQKTYKWCNKFPFRCATTSTSYRIGYKNETKIQLVKVEKCCKGYAEIRSRCIPICSNPCIHGVCMGPEQCQCSPGWSGLNCNFCKCPCPRRYLGESCKDGCSISKANSTECEPICNCKNDGICDEETGECKCKPGYTGAKCEKKCSEGFYGSGCLSKCACTTVEGYYCDHILGCVCESCNNIASSLLATGHLSNPIEQITTFKTESQTSSLFIGVLLCLMSMFGFLAILFVFHKKRINKIKEDFYATYTSTTPPNDRFENPMYDYASVGGTVECKIASPSCSKTDTCVTVLSTNGFSGKGFNYFKYFKHNKSKPTCFKNEKVENCSAQEKKLSNKMNVFEPLESVKEHAVDNEYTCLPSPPPSYKQLNFEKSSSFYCDKNDPIYEEIGLKLEEEEVVGATGETSILSNASVESHYDCPKPIVKVINYENIDKKEEDNQ